MPRRPLTLALSLLVVGALAFSACGADVDSAKDATSTTSDSTSNGKTSTTSEDDTDRTTTTEAERSTRPSGDAAPYVQAMVESMTSDDDFPGTDAQAKCLSTETIDVIGVDRLRANGVTPDDLRDGDSSMDMSEIGLTMDEGNEIYDALEKCDIDLRALMMEGMSDDQDEEIPAEAKQCLEQILTDDNLRKLMVTSIVKGEDAIENDPALKGITAGLVGCMFMAMGSSTTAP